MQKAIGLVLILLANVAFGADAPWLTYRVYPGELAIRDPEPALAVYGDGRVEVYRPMWQTNAGRFEYFLSPHELSELVELATAPLLVATDLAKTEEDLDQAEQRIAREEKVVYAISDPEVYHVEIDPAAAPGSLAPKAGPVSLVWTMVHPDLAKQAAIPAAQRLDAFRDRLQGMATIDGAQRIGDATQLQDLNR